MSADLLQQVVLGVARTNVRQARGRALEIRQAIDRCGERTAGDGAVRIFRVELGALLLALKADFARVVEFGDTLRFRDIAFDQQAIQ